MSLVGGLSAAVSGIYAGGARANAAANNIANVTVEGYKAVEIRTSTVTTQNGAAAGVLVHAQEKGRGPELAEEFVNLIEAETAYKASAKVTQTVDDLYKQLIDIRG